MIVDLIFNNDWASSFVSAVFSYKYKVHGYDRRTT